jgi:tetratricopeptide (TPR) repeat protein
LREAVDIAAQLEKQDPTITSIRENGALYKMQLSRLLRLTGSVDEASKLTNEALDTFAELVRQDASNTSWQREFAEARSERAAQMLSTGNTQEARKLLESALAWFEPALESRPNDRNTVLATVNARLLLATADDTRARALREHCLESVNGVKSGTDDPRLLALKVYALVGLGKTGEAQPAIERLRTNGYRDPAFVEAMRRSNIAFFPRNSAGPSAIRGDKEGCGQLTRNLSSKESTWQSQPTSKRITLWPMPWTSRTMAAIQVAR